MAKKCTAPAFFIHADGDTTIDPKYASKLLQAYGGKDKSLKMCFGDHNTQRPEEITSEAIKFLETNLLL